MKLSQGLGYNVITRQVITLVSAHAKMSITFLNYILKDNTSATQGIPIPAKMFMQPLTNIIIKENLIRPLIYNVFPENTIFVKKMTLSTPQQLTTTELYRRGENALNRFSLL